MGGRSPVVDGVESPLMEALEGAAVFDLHHLHDASLPRLLPVANAHGMRIHLIPATQKGL